RSLGLHGNDLEQVVNRSRCSLAAGARPHLDLVNARRQALDTPGPISALATEMAPDTGPLPVDGSDDPLELAALIGLVTDAGADLDRAVGRVDITDIQRDGRGARGTADGRSAPDGSEAPGHQLAQEIPERVEQVRIALEHAVVLGDEVFPRFIAELDRRCRDA